MSLLLDARKKAQQALSSQSGTGSLSAQNPDPGQHIDSSTKTASSSSSQSFNTTERARSAGQNLFNAKSRGSSFGFATVNRKLLIALGGTFVLLIAGAIYVWYTVSQDNTRQFRPVNKPAQISSQPIATPKEQPQIQPQVAAATQKDIPAPERTKSPVTSIGSNTRTKPAHIAKASPKAPRTRSSDTVMIERIHEEPLDPILNDAYAFYRSGKLEQSQQQYLKALNLDRNNIDALLGLAAIAQRRGEDNIAAHYYGKVMSLDPRNAVANAGLSVITNGDNRESRLKSLLNEQPDSSSLHFALGNYYAEQSRWADAQQSYFNAFKLLPNNAELAFNLAVSLDHLDQRKTAAQYYETALKLDPDNHANFDHAKISLRIEELNK